MFHFLVRKILRKFMYFMKQMCKMSFDMPETRKVFSVWELLATLIKLTAAKHPYYSQCNTTKRHHSSSFDKDGLQIWNFFWFLAMMKGFVQIHFPNLNFFNSLEPYVLLSCFSCSRQYPHDELVISHSTSSCHSHNCTPNSSGCNYCVTITGYFCCSSLAICCSACQGVLHRSLKLGMGANFGPPVHLCLALVIMPGALPCIWLKSWGSSLTEKFRSFFSLFIVFCILMKEALYRHNFRSCFPFKYSKGKVGLWLKTVV